MRDDQMIADDDDYLTDWEREFLASIDEWEGELTPGQEARLAEIEALVEERRATGWKPPAMSRRATHHRELSRRRWRIEQTHGGHLKLLEPGRPVIFAPSTPSDRRGLANILASLRRADRAPRR